jgi:peptidoglycan/xylan/chitin deacetylase (PgdA/CDA1 family)
MGFVISLDFELMWGMRDVRTLHDYGRNILGVRQAIPAMLSLFGQYDVKATWAAVGMLMFETRDELLEFAPAVRPTYRNCSLSPYKNGYLDRIGRNEKEDPYHFGLSLVRQILDTQGMELASHTFSHYYCMEEGQTEAQFSADLSASIAASDRLGVRPVSLVFPRNQFNSDYLAACAHQGFRAYRGNEASWLYRFEATQRQTALQRAFRLADNYLNVTGSHAFVPRYDEITRMVDVTSSRFLRPFSDRLGFAEPLRIARITNAMTAAAKAGASFHLWWHPHNFGMHLEENLAALERILRQFCSLRDRYGMRSETMAEAAMGATQ